MTVDEAQAEATRRWGDYGFAWIDGSLRHQVGFYDGENDNTAGAIVLGSEATFEDAFKESESDDALKSLQLFFPAGAKFWNPKVSVNG